MASVLAAMLVQLVLTVFKMVTRKGLTVGALEIVHLVQHALMVFKTATRKGLIVVAPETVLLVQTVLMVFEMATRKVLTVVAAIVKNVVIDVRAEEFNVALLSN